MFQECPDEVSENGAECGVCELRPSWRLWAQCKERCSDEVKADTEGSALRSSLLELVIVENEGILSYGSMFVTCFGFIEVVDACGSESDEYDKRSMV